MKKKRIDLNNMTDTQKYLNEFVLKVTRMGDHNPAAEGKPVEYFVSYPDPGQFRIGSFVF